MSNSSSDSYYESGNYAKRIRRNLFRDRLGISMSDEQSGLHEMLVFNNFEGTLIDKKDIYLWLETIKRLNKIRCFCSESELDDLITKYQLTIQSKSKNAFVRNIAKIERYYRRHLSGILQKQSGFCV